MNKLSTKNIFFTSIFFFFVTLSNSQTIKIYSLNDNQPLPNARIDLVENNQEHHYKSDLEGVFELPQQFKKKEITLHVSYFGYLQKTTTTAFTQDTTIYLKPSVQSYNEVAITAQYKRQKVINAVHNIEIINQRKIQAMAAQNLKDVLTNELNVRLGEDMVLGSSMQIQGVGGQNVKILVDGVPMTGRLNGNIDLSQIPLESIQRIEIVKGPLSVSYGTDALGGTINIITKKEQQKKVDIYLNNYIESSGKFNNAGTVGFRLGKHQFRINGGRRFFDGWDPSQQPFYYNSHPVADSTRAQLWNPKIQWFGGLNYRYKRKNTVFNYGGQFFNENIINKGYPRAPYQITAFDDYYNTKRINQRAFFLYRFEEHKVNVLAGYNGYLRRKNTKIRDLTTIKDELSGNTSAHDTSQFHSFNLRGSYTHSSNKSKINFQLGYDIIYEIAKGPKITGNRQNIGDYALFGTAEYSPVSNLIIRPGLRYGYNTNYNSPLTPSLNIKYDFFKKSTQKFSLRTSYARGFRAPTVKELHYEFIDINHNIVGNPNLDAEYSNQFNFSIHQYVNKSSLQMNNKIGLFYTDIHDLITMAQKTPTSTEYSYFNLDRYTTTGVQLESKINYKELTIGIGAGYIGRNNHLEATSEKRWIDQFLFSPEATLSIQYEWKKMGLLIGAFYKYTGELPNLYTDGKGELTEIRIADYHIADITVSKYVWKKRLKFTLGVKNLFNVTTINGTSSISQGAHSSGNGSLAIGMGRTYNLGIVLHLNVP